MQRLGEQYQKTVKSALKEEFAFKNEMAIPKITKVVVNMGTGDQLRNPDVKAKILADLSSITGQKPKVQLARISVAGFNVREGSPVGLTVTLRGERMYSFLDKLFSIVFPRLRDFRGIPTKSFDGRGNYTLGFAEHTVFPEIDLAKVDRPRGLEITIVTTAKDNETAKRLLTLMGMPFVKEE